MSTGSGTGTILATESFIPTSAVSICNMALGHLGAKPITSIDEESQEARYCKIFWDVTRDSVLRSYDWNFARLKIALTSVDVPAEHEEIWQYCYTLPSDFLAIQEINSVVSKAGVDYVLAMEALSAGGQRHIILTNLEEAYLTYTAKVEDTTLYDPIFVKSLALAMAAELAVPVTKNPQIAQIMLGKYLDSIPKAKGRDFKEEQDSEEVTDSWITDRWGG